MFNINLIVGNQSINKYFFLPLCFFVFSVDSISLISSFISSFLLLLIISSKLVLLSSFKFVVSWFWIFSSGVSFISLDFNFISTFSSVISIDSIFDSPFSSLWDCCWAEFFLCFFFFLFFFCVESFGISLEISLIFSFYVFLCTLNLHFFFCFVLNCLL